MLRAFSSALRPVVNAPAAVSASIGRRCMSSGKAPVRVAVTGASGQIGYALLFRIASGAMLGPDQPVILQLLELPHAVKALDGVIMELKDCAFPLVKDIVGTDDVNRAFEGANVAMLVGAKPRGPGMERGDLLRDNGAIFTVQGKALNANADRDNLKVVVVGNPANTNAWIAQQSAPDIPAESFSAMTRLDHNRGLAQLADKLNCGVEDINDFAIWGNHSSTQYPDISHATVNGQKITELVDEEWTKKNFMPTVQKRGAAIIDARGASSAASAASSAIDHIHDWVHGTNGKWTSMAIPSDGSYGTEKGVFYSFPVTVENGKVSIVQGLPVSDFSREMMDITNEELKGERDEVKSALGL